MENLFGPLSLFVDAHFALSLVLLFLGVLWEGEFVLLIAGVLTHTGVLPITATLAVTLLAAVAKMLLGYRLGMYIGRRFPKSRFLKHAERKVFHYLPAFRERPFWSIFLSKFIYGVNNVTLVFAGYVRANFKVYCRAEIISSVIWFGSLFSLGYFFSKKAFAISSGIHHFTLFAFIFIFALVVLERFVILSIEFIETQFLGKGRS